MANIDIIVNARGSARTDRKDSDCRRDDRGLGNRRHVRTESFFG